VPPPSHLIGLKLSEWDVMPCLTCAWVFAQRCGDPGRELKQPGGWAAADCLA
jgi:hypothetical protein